MNLLDLSILNWTLNSSLPGFQPIPAEVPGDNYSALLKNGIIPDPNLKMNEIDVQFYREHDWTFSTEFEISREFLDKRSVFLNIDSPDTFAVVRINGKKAAESKNMFRRLRAEVKPFLQCGKNTLEIEFASPERIAKELFDKLPFPLPYVSDNRVPHQNLIRKMQCASGWDWGICLLTSGIAGKVYLQAVDHARIEHVYTEQQHVPGKAVLKVTAELFSDVAETLPLTVSFNGKTETLPVNCSSGITAAAVEFTVEDPELWYPAGYGQQPLYDLTVSTPEISVSKKIGLRQLEMDTAPDEIGVPLTCRVNGIPIFAKGANWIPVDGLPGNFTEETYRRLITQAAEANMNMLRVWGGGIYENDVFYEICDELGILVWQDFMFACNRYPVSVEFLDEVYQEVIYQGKRLRDHASLALWCGDNENSAYINAPDVPIRDIVCYERLNYTIARAIAEGDPTRLFWPSSPCHGPLDFENVWTDDTRGDMHIWRVCLGGADIEEYRKMTPRFCSEFGYQAFPSMNTVNRFLDGVPARNITSPVFEFHQRHQKGNFIITQTLSKYFRYPDTLEHFVYLSQVQQSFAIKTGVEYWRSRKPVCMGALYWQLNDNWPVASWSSIDYYGNWKQLHYQAARFYAPIMTTALYREGCAEIYVSSDLVSDASGMVLVRCIDWSGNTVKKWELPFTVTNEKAVLAGKLDLNQEQFDARKGFVHLELRGESDGKHCCHTNELWLDLFKKCPLKQAHISAVWETDPSEKPVLVLESDAPAFYVFAELNGTESVFSDNSLTLLPGEPARLILRSCGNTDPEYLRNNLVINDLRSSYTE